MEKKDKRQPFAGIMFAFMYYSKKSKVLMIIGSVLIVIGFIGTFYFGSKVLNDTVQGKLNPADSRPYPVNGVSPLYAEISFIGIAIVGLAILGLGIAIGSRSAIKSKRPYY
jgi:hypothetical protein